MAEKLTEEHLKEYHRMVATFIGDSRGGPAHHITALVSHIDWQQAEIDRLTRREARLPEMLTAARIRALDEAAKTAITVANRYGEKHLIGREVYKAIFKLMEPPGVNADAAKAIAALESAEQPQQGER